MTPTKEEFIAGIKARAAMLLRHGIRLGGEETFSKYDPNTKKKKEPGQVYYGFKKKKVE